MRVLFCLSLLCLGSAAFAADWVGLLRNSDHTELERLGDKAGAVGLAPILASGTRPERLAALRALRGARDSWALLGLLASTAADPDRSIAVIAAQVAAEEAHQLDAFTIENEEVLTSDLLHWQQAWLELATQDNRWVDIRIYSLEVGVTLGHRIAKARRQPIPWELLFGDSDPEMRAAAIALAPQGTATTKQAHSFVKSDTQEVVALAAAQRMCGPLGSATTPDPPTVDDITLRRLRALSLNQSLAIQARVDLANCLARDPSSESRRSMSALVQQSPPALRKALLRLTQTAAQ